MSAYTLVVDPVSLPLQPHLGMEVRQMEEGSSRLHGKEMSSIETKEIHARLTLVGDISPYIDLKKSGGSGDAGKSTHPNPAHAEGDDR